MAESYVEVTEGSGKKLHALSRTVNSQTVYDEAVTAAIPHLPSYIVRSYNASLATAGDHLLQIMAGSTNNVYITKLRMFQIVLATTLSLGQFSLVRLTSAGTGGTAITPLPLDTTDPASNATAMRDPSSNGTEGDTLVTSSGVLLSAWGTDTGRPVPMIYDFDSPYTKPLRIPKGTTNGLAVRNVSAIAAASVVVEVTYFEAPY